MTSPSSCSGQTCVRPDYLMVHEQVADEFIERVKGVLQEFYGPDARASDWFGRLVMLVLHSEREATRTVV